MRLPIIVLVLHKLVHSLEHTAVNRYDYVLFRAMFLFAFETLSPVGEITSGNEGAHKIIQFSDVNFCSSWGSSLVEVTFRYFKHNLTKTPHKVSFGKGPACFSAVEAIT